MQLHDDLEIGAASHTGQVRSTNEDDFLILSPMEQQTVRSRGRLLAIADGMGGVAGGAEASRTAVRFLATAFLAAPPDRSPAERLKEAFSAASRAVLDRSQEIPPLREMGTTLTAVNLIGGTMVLGHVGDSRCYLMRDGELSQLTTDHAVREPENYLTRCIGGGQKEEDPDLMEVTLQPGDLVVLLTDGLWSVVGEGELAGILTTQPPQAAANALLHAANAGGGPDNSTVLLAQVRRTDGELGELREVELPREEQRMRPMVPTPRGGLVPPRWPWWLMALAAALLALGLLKLFAEIDGVAAIVDWVAALFA